MVASASTGGGGAVVGLTADVVHALSLRLLKDVRVGTGAPGRTVAIAAAWAAQVQRAKAAAAAEYVDTTQAAHEWTNTEGGAEERRRSDSPDAVGPFAAASLSTHAALPADDVVATAIQVARTNGVRVRGASLSNMLLLDLSWRTACNVLRMARRSDETTPEMYTSVMRALVSPSSQDRRRGFLVAGGSWAMALRAFVEARDAFPLAPPDSAATTYAVRALAQSVPQSFAWGGSGRVARELADFDSAPTWRSMLRLFRDAHAASVARPGWLCGEGGVQLCNGAMQAALRLDTARPGTWAVALSVYANVLDANGDTAVPGHAMLLPDADTIAYAVAALLRSKRRDAARRLVHRMADTVGFRWVDTSADAFREAILLSLAPPVSSSRAAAAAAVAEGDVESHNNDDTESAAERAREAAAEAAADTLSRGRTLAFWLDVVVRPLLADDRAAASLTLQHLNGCATVAAAVAKYVAASWRSRQERVRRNPDYRSDDTLWRAAARCWELSSAMAEAPPLLLLRATATAMQLHPGAPKWYRAALERDWGAAAPQVVGNASAADLMLARRCATRPGSWADATRALQSYLAGTRGLYAAGGAAPVNDGAASATGLDTAAAGTGDAAGDGDRSGVDSGMSDGLFRRYRPEHIRSVSVSVAIRLALETAALSPVGTPRWLAALAISAAAAADDRALLQAPSLQPSAHTRLVRLLLPHATAVAADAEVAPSDAAARAVRAALTHHWLHSTQPAQDRAAVARALLEAPMPESDIARSSAQPQRRRAGGGGAKMGRESSSAHDAGKKSSAPPTNVPAASMQPAALDSLFW
jgi:hypothetical protein